MINSVLAFLRDGLNAHLAARTGPLPSNGTLQAQLTRLVDDQGRSAIPASSIGIALVNIEEERTFRSQLPSHTYVDGQHVVEPPDLKLILHVLIAAHFNAYDQALTYLAHVLTFFQAHTLFTPLTDPALDPSVDQLTVELQSLTYEQLNQVWAFIGGKHLPCAMYKVRLAIIQDHEPIMVGPPILRVNSLVEST